MTIKQIEKLLVKMAAVHQNENRDELSEKTWKEYQSNQKKVVDEIGPLVDLLCESGVLHAVLRMKEGEEFISFDFDYATVNGGIQLEADESRLTSHSENYLGMRFKRKAGK